MQLHLWLGLAASFAVVTAIPGPTVLLITTHAVSFGRRVAIAMVLGSALGVAVAMTLAMAGLGALLATSALAFAVLKLFGAAYFIWLGVRLWRRDPVALAAQTQLARIGSLRAFGHAFLVTALNPKGIAFFLLFLPLFIDRAAPIVPQMLVVVPTLAAVGMITDGLYAAFAVRMRGLVRRPRVMRIVNRAGGSLLIALGLATALRRAA
jgi:threonine/homoserine/homoserine lactone efflux protein